MRGAAGLDGSGEARASIALLRERIARVPAILRAASARSWDAASAALEDDVAVTGVGASAGPARLLAWLLAHRLRRAARFVPPSAFARAEPPPARTLVVVSQGLSPNARLALRHAHRYERVLVLTSTPPADDGAARVLAEIASRGGVVCVLPPASEEGTFLRVVGPATAALAVIAIAERARGAADLGAILAAVPDVVATAADSAIAAASHVPSERLDGPIAIASVGVDPSALHAHRWKWLEGLRAPEPSGWDLLEIAHGPIQAAPPALPFVVLASADDDAGDLLRRLDDMLAVTGQPRVVLRSALRFPFSFLDHDAQLGALLLRVLDERPRDLRTSACAVHDEPLYGLGR